MRILPFNKVICRGSLALIGGSLVACAAGNVPSNATITVSPSEISYAVVQSFGEVGVQLRYLDVNVRFMNSSGFEQPVANADLQVSIDFDTTSSSFASAYLLDPTTFPAGTLGLTAGTIRTLDAITGQYQVRQSNPIVEALCDSSYPLYFSTDIQRLPFFADNQSAADNCDGRLFGPGFDPLSPIVDATPETCDDDAGVPIFPYLGAGDPYGCPATRSQLVGLTGFCPSRYFLPSGSTVRTGDDGSITIPVALLTFPPAVPSAAAWDDTSGICTLTFEPQVVTYSGSIRVSAGNVVGTTVDFSITGG